MNQSVHILFVHVSSIEEENELAIRSILHGREKTPSIPIYEYIFLYVPAIPFHPAYVHVATTLV